MPEMDGVETLHKIRNTENEYFQTVPVVALTAEAITGSQEYFLKEGFQDYLSKPIAINLLEQILQRILGNGR